MHHRQTALPHFPVPLVFVLLVTFNACNNSNTQQVASKPLPVEASPSSTQSASPTSSAEPGSNSSKPVAIDPTAVNENGHVVLEAEEPASSVQAPQQAKIELAVASPTPEVTKSVAPEPAATPSNNSVTPLVDALGSQSSKAELAAPAVNTVATPVNTRSKAPRSKRMSPLTLSVISNWPPTGRSLKRYYSFQVNNMDTLNLVDALA